MKNITANAYTPIMPKVQKYPILANILKYRDATVLPTYKIEIGKFDHSQNSFFKQIHGPWQKLIAVKKQRLANAKYILKPEGENTRNGSAVKLAKRNRQPAPKKQNIIK